MPEIPASEDVPLPADERTQPMWRDSSRDLGSGLDVIELYVDVVLPLEPVLPQPAT